MPWGPPLCLSFICGQKENRSIRILCDCVCEDRNEELDRNGYLLGKLETTTKLLLCCVLLPREWEKGMLVYIREKTMGLTGVTMEMRD